MQYFNNKVWIEPSTGVRIVTNVAPTPNLLSSGVVAVLGESDGGLTYADSIVYESSQPNFLKNIMRGGTAYRCIDYIFTPSLTNQGAQKVLFVRTQAATKATATITQLAGTGGACTMVMTSVDRGAYLSTATVGLAWKLVAGTVDTAKEVLILQLLSTTIWTSPECGTFTELIDAVEADTYASSVITCAVTSGSGASAIDTATRTASYEVFTGGTSPAMVGTDVDAALLLLTTLGANVLYIASNDAALHAKVLAFANTVSEFPAVCVFGGAASETVAQVKARALTFNSENAVLCYPDIVVPTEDYISTETLSPMYFAAFVAGLTSGLQPYEPLTWKTVNVLGFSTSGGDLNATSREDLITHGVLYGRMIKGVGYAINKGINTLQTNGSMIYKTVSGEATSPEVSIIRIKQQLVSELVQNSASLFVGGTVATVTKEDVINFTKSYLKSRCSTTTSPNSLISFQDVTVELSADAWSVYFGFTPNTPINHVFFTGAMLKP